MLMRASLENRWESGKLPAMAWLALFRPDGKMCPAQDVPKPKVLQQARRRSGAGKGPVLGGAREHPGAWAADGEIWRQYLVRRSARRRADDHSGCGQRAPSARCFTREGVPRAAAGFDDFHHPHPLGSHPGAGLDVHESEGEGNISPLASLANVILTPHIGAQTADSQREIGERMVRIVDDFFTTPIAGASTKAL